MPTARYRGRVAAAGAVATLMFTPAAASGETTAESGKQADMLGRLAFEVRRDGAKIGTHVLTFRQPAPGRLAVHIEIELSVGFGPITLYRYSHRNDTLWADGRLLSMDTRTDDDGDKHFVRARRTEDGNLRVESDSGTRMAPGDILPTTYWPRATVAQERLLNTQTGEVAEVEVRPLTDGEARPVKVAAGAEGYAMTGDVQAHIWYAPDGRWTALAFDGRGERVTYHPMAREGTVPTVPPVHPES